jgi:hypothetical protein
VPRRARERAPPADVAHDRRHDPERRVGPQQLRSLLDVKLDIGLGTSGEAAAAGAAALLVAEDHDPETRCGEPFDRLQPRHHAERPVETARAGNGVEVRARPDLALAAGDPADQVAGGVDLGLEPRLKEPAGRKRVCGVLLGRVADPVAEGGQLVEALQDPHARSLD